MQPYSAESSVTRNYIGAVLDLPWDKSTKRCTKFEKSFFNIERELWFEGC